MTSEIIFGTCNHSFTRHKEKKPSYNLVKIYPEETKIDIAYIGKEAGIPIMSTLIYGAEPPKPPPRLKKAKAVQNGGVAELAATAAELATQVSMEGNSLLCGCIPKSPKLLVQKQNKTTKE